MGIKIPSEDTGEGDLLHFCKSEKIRGDDNKLFVCPVCLFLFCGKCCSSLPTLPGAHPVCEIFDSCTSVQMKQ